MMVGPLTFSASHRLFPGAARDGALHVPSASPFCQLSVLAKFRDKYYLSLHPPLNCARMDLIFQSCPALIKLFLE